MASKRLQATITIGGAVASSLTSAFGTVKNQTNQVGSALSNLEGQQRQLSRSIETFGRMGKNVDGMRQRYAVLTQQIDKLRTAQDRLNRVERARADNQAARANYHGQMMGVAATAMALGAPIRTAMNFESAMAKVAAVSNATEEDLGALTRTARQLGATTAWSASEAAEGMQYLAMAGFKTNDIVSAMPGMLDLASAAKVDLGRAADIASNILTGFGLKAEEMGRAGDVLTKAFTNSNTSLEMLGDTMKYVGPVAAGVGVSLEQAAAMAGKLGDAGIQGSMAGTAMRAILGRLAGPPKKAAEALAELGVSTVDAMGNLRDVPTILAEIDAAAKNLGSAKRAELFKAIAGDEAFSALLTLTEQAGSGALQQFADELTESGVAARVAQRQNDNARGSLVQLGSALESIAISIGNILLPTVKDGALALAGFVNVIDKFAQEYPMVTKAVVGGVAALMTLKIATFAAGYAYTFLRGGILSVQHAIARGRAVMALAAVQNTTLSASAAAAGTSIKTAALGMVTAIRAVGVALVTNPIGAVIAGIAAAGFMIYRHWDGVKAFMVGTFQGMRGGLEPLVQTFREFWDSLAPVRDMFGSLGGVLKTAWEWFKGLIGPVEYSADELGKAGEAGKTFGEYLAAGINFVLTPLQLLIQGITWVNNNIGAVLDKAVAFKEAVGGKIDGAMDRVGSAWSGAKSFFGFGDDEPAAAAGPDSLPQPTLATGRGGAGTYTDQSQTTIQVVQQPGQSTRELAREITRLQEQERAARQRSVMADGAMAQ